MRAPRKSYASNHVKAVAFEIHSSRSFIIYSAKHSRFREHPSPWVYLFSALMSANGIIMEASRKRRFFSLRVYFSSIARGYYIAIKLHGDVLCAFLRREMRVHLCRSSGRILGRDAWERKEISARAQIIRLTALRTTNKTLSGNWMLTGTSFAFKHEYNECEKHLQQSKLSSAALRLSILSSIN